VAAAIEEGHHRLRAAEERNFSDPTALLRRLGSWRDVENEGNVVSGPDLQWPIQQQRQPSGYAYPPPPEVQIFQVTTVSHIGALVFWFNQRHVVRGTYAQCDAALRSAQTQNLIVGWWSFLSILILNWIALLHNSAARRQLNRDVQQARDYAEWWHRYIGHGQGPTGSAGSAPGWRHP